VNDGSIKPVAALLEVAWTMATMEDGTDNAPFEIDDATASSTNSPGMEVSSHPIFAHWAYNMLDSRTPFIIDAKVEILTKFKGYTESIFHPSSTKGENISAVLSYITETDVKVLKGVGQPKLAEFLVTLIMTLEKSDLATRTRQQASPDCIKALREFTKECKTHLEAQSAKATVAPKGGGKVRLPKKTNAYGKPWQEKHAETHGAFKPTEGALNPVCPSCRFLTTISVVEVEEANKQIIEKHRLEVETWTSKGGAASGKAKPKRGKTKSNTMACHASTQNCLLDPEGIGCFLCAALCAAGTPPDLQPHGNLLICSCPLCQCTCDLVFYRDQRTALAAELATAKAMAAGEMEASKLLGIFAFTAPFVAVTHSVFCLLLFPPPCS
jgi:hypothetical protein